MTECIHCRPVEDTVTHPMVAAKEWRTNTKAKKSKDKEYIFFLKNKLNYLFPQADPIKTIKFIDNVHRLCNDAKNLHSSLINLLKLHPLYSVNWANVKKFRTIFLYFVKGLKITLDWGANTPDMCPDISIKPSFSGVRGHDAMCEAFPPCRIHLNPAGKWLQTWLVQSAHSKNIHLVKENTGLWGTNWEEFDPQYKGVFQRGGEEGGRKSWSQKRAGEEGG